MNTITNKRVLRFEIIKKYKKTLTTKTVKFQTFYRFFRLELRLTKLLEKSKNMSNETSIGC